MIQCALVGVLMFIPLLCYASQKDDMTVSMRFQALSLEQEDDWTVLGNPADYKDAHARMEELKRENEKERLRADCAENQAEHLTKRVRILEACAASWKKKHQLLYMQLEQEEDQVEIEQKEKEQLVKAHKSITSALMQKHSQETEVLSNNIKVLERLVKSQKNELTTVRDRVTCLELQLEQASKENGKALSEAGELRMQAAEKMVEILELQEQRAALEKKNAVLEKILSAASSKAGVMRSEMSEKTTEFLALQEKHTALERNNKAFEKVLSSIASDLERIDRLRNPTPGTVAKRDMPQRQKEAETIEKDLFRKRTHEIKNALKNKKS